MSIFSELKRRNVLRVGAAYVVTAWLVIQVVETIFPAFGFGDAAVRYVTIAFAVGLLPALVVAWVFELTPEGLVKDSDADQSRPFAVDAAKRLDRIILVVLALALGYFAFDKFVLDPERDVQIAEAARQEGRTEAKIDAYGNHSIAVLAFRDLSPGGDQAYLSEGIADEVLNLLAQLPELRVISRPSAFSYQGTDTPVTQIAEELDVTYVLEGSVRKAGNQIRVTVQLIDASVDVQVWSKTYDRTLDDIFAIQDELAAGIVGQLESALLDRLPGVEQIDPNVYVSFLQARSYLGNSRLEDAVQLLEVVVRREPGYADAWASLGLAYAILSPTMGTTHHEGDDIFQKLMGVRARLSELAPDHPFILATSAWATVELSADYAGAALLFTRALEAHPQDQDVLSHTSLFAYILGDDELAVQLSGRAVVLNPLCTHCVYSHAQRLISSGRYEEAERAITRYMKIRPGEAGGELTLLKARLLMGDIPGATETLRQRGDEHGQIYGHLLMALLGEPDRNMRPEIEKFAQMDSYLNPLGAAELHALNGDFKPAFENLDEIAAGAANWRLAAILRSPLLSKLQADPRWNELMERAGVAPSQVAKVEFDPVLAWNARE